MGETEVQTDFTEKKQCAVCGDHALCYNFNAVTCESCKAFFRRNANKEKSLKCAFKNVCEITRVTRRFCQSCRLAKCLDVGMKRELILSDTQKELKRRKIEVNKAMSGRQLAGREQTSPPMSVPVLALDSSRAGDGTDPEGTLVVTLSGSSFTESSTQTTRDQVDAGIQTEPWECFCNAPASNDRILFKQKEEMGLNSSHQKLLDNLIAANDALEAPVDLEVSNLTGDEFKNWKGRSENLLDVINLTAVAIRRLIKMCKRIIGFRSLCQPDQVALLKHGCTQMMLLRSILSFDPDKNSWKIPHTKDHIGRIKVEVLKEAEGNLYEAHKNFFRTFDPRASRDKYLIQILIAITLFDPSRPNLSHPDNIRTQQECYQDLLKRYLKTEYSERESEEIFDHLLFKMKELHWLNEEHIRVYLNVDPSQVEPLLIEIFDLKTP